MFLQSGSQYFRGQIPASLGLHTMTATTSIKTSTAITANIAMIRFQFGDSLTAESFFTPAVTRFAAEDGWIRDEEAEQDDVVPFTVIISSL